MSELAARLVDRVLPHVPIRQWVFTVPVPVRYQLAFDAIYRPPPRCATSLGRDRSSPSEMARSCKSCRQRPSSSSLLISRARAVSDRATGTVASGASGPFQRLIVSYHRLGRRADALAVYERCRYILAAVLGVDPSPETERLRRALQTEP